MADARPALRAACRATQEANLVLLLREVTDVMVGTRRIFVPSENLVDAELYQMFNLSQTSCSLSTAHST